MFHRHSQRISHISGEERGKLAQAMGSRLAANAQESALRCIHSRRHTPNVRQGEYAFPFHLISVEPEESVTQIHRQHLRDAITALRNARERDASPVYSLKLAEYLAYEENYVEAVQTVADGVNSEPNDIRLVYALATLYRELGRARSDEAERMYGPGFPERGFLLATPAIEDACSRLGLTAEDARELAAEHFSRVLTMHVHPEERQAVQDSLQIMQEMLQGKVQETWEI